MKLSFVDKNESLVKKVSELFEKYKRNKAGFELIAECGDVFKYQKENGGKICTASNPDFNMAGGLDALIAKKFPEEVKEAEEFRWTENLFFLLTVDKNLKSSQKIIARSLAGVYAYRYKFDVILTGIGTGIGGLKEDDFVYELERLLNADLSSADLRSADLSYANLSYADLSSADLSYANLSESKGIKNMAEWFYDNFKMNKKGFVVYKAIGNTHYELNKKWIIKKGEYLEEVVNPSVNCDCGCGVNFGTLKYVKKEFTNSNIWECLIEFKDLVEVVVPWDTDGKARCRRLKLIKKL
jgi:hypothetical protein